MARNYPTAKELEAFDPEVWGDCQAVVTKSLARCSRKATCCRDGVLLCGQHAKRERNLCIRRTT
jgi:hypothetical protein